MFIMLLAFLTIRCAPLKAPTVTKNGTLEGYKYIYITPTANLTSASGGVYGNQYGVYGAAATKTVNPGDARILLKEGYTRVHELRPELLDETIVVNYGESGRRDRGLGYTI